MSLVFLFLSLASAADLRVDLGTGTNWVDKSAHYEPMLSGFLRVAIYQSAVGLSVEATGNYKKKSETQVSEIYSHEDRTRRVSALLKVRLGHDDQYFKIGLGPSARYNLTSISIVNEKKTMPTTVYGGRAQVGGSIKIKGHLDFVWSTGVLIQQNGLDYDSNIGVGWRI